MAEYTCHNCVYAVCDPCRWLRLMSMGEPILPRCANHPWYPGRLHEVPGIPCRNYRPRTAAPEGDQVRMIPLGDGFYAYVDAGDYEWLSRWNWHLCNGYAGRSEKGKIILMHRLIMQPPRGMVVDHIDGSKANNCRFNLRNCTREQNMHNKRGRSDSSSIYKGVYRDKRTGKWNARCRYKGKNHGLGCFGDDEVAAARAYDRQAVEWFGEYARPNFPNEWPPQRRVEVRAAYEAQLAKQRAAKRTVPRTKRKTPNARHTTNKGRIVRANHDSPSGRVPKRKPHDAKRTTKPPHAGTPERRVGERETKSKRATGHESRTTSARVRATSDKGRATKRDGERRTKAGRSKGKKVTQRRAAGP